MGEGCVLFESETKAQAYPGVRGGRRLHLIRVRDQSSGFFRAEGWALHLISISDQSPGFHRGEGWAQAASYSSQRQKPKLPRG